MNHPLNAVARVATLATFAVLTLPPLAQAQDQPVFAHRSACIDRAEALPDFALAEARLWERQGGGADARLCQALAQMLRGDWEAAAPMLEASAAELTREPLVARANLWSRAATAWSNIHKNDKAEAALGQALTLTPKDPQLLLDRAILHAGTERYWDAVSDLDKVIALAPKLAEAWLLRAQAYHVLAQDTKAMSDVLQLLQLSPQNSEGLLLRGNLYAAKSDMVHAKQDWESVRRVAAGTPAAAVALENLNGLDRAQTEQKRELKKKEKQPR